MAWFVTIGYGDSAGYEQTDPAVLENAVAQGVVEVWPLLSSAGPT